MMDVLLTVKEAAEKLGVSPRTIQRYCRQGKLKHKWIQGLRHKELRIIPPLFRKGITRGLAGTANTPVHDEREMIISRLEQELEAKDRKLDRLTMEIGRNTELAAMAADYKARIHELSEENRRLQDTVNKCLRETRLGELEKKLILRIAKDLSSMKEILAE